MATRTTFQAHVMVSGAGRGEALVLPEALSLWGGLDPETGNIIDQRHPSFGANVAGRVLVMPIGRGSSSASSILLEAVRMGTAPAAIITVEADAILALGAAVAREMYGKAPPIMVLPAEAYDQLSDGQQVAVAEDGTVLVTVKARSQLDVRI